MKEFMGWLIYHFENGKTMCQEWKSAVGIRSYQKAFPPLYISNVDQNLMKTHRF